MELAEREAFEAQPRKAPSSPNANTTLVCLRALIARLEDRMAGEHNLLNMDNVSTLDWIVNAQENLINGLVELERLKISMKLKQT